MMSEILEDLLQRVQVQEGEEHSLKEKIVAERLKASMLCGKLFESGLDKEHLEEILSAYEKLNETLNENF